MFLEFYPRSVVRNNPPRKAVAENLGILSHLVDFLMLFEHIFCQGFDPLAIVVMSLVL